MDLSASMFGSLGPAFAQFIPILYSQSVEGPIELSLGSP